MLDSGCVQLLGRDFRVAKLFRSVSLSSSLHFSSVLIASFDLLDFTPVSFDRTLQCTTSSSPLLNCKSDARVQSEAARTFSIDSTLAHYLLHCAHTHMDFSICKAYYRAHDAGSA